MRPKTTGQFGLLFSRYLRVKSRDVAGTAIMLAQAPIIGVPTITLEGDANGAPHLDPTAYAGRFSGKYSHRLISGGIGHNLPQEAPQAFAQAIVDVDGS